MKSIRTTPAVHAAEGDERIRTAVCSPSADPAYEKHPTLYAKRGCGRCAEIIAAGLLTGGSYFYDTLAEHQRNHKREPSRLWGDLRA